jgi:hypothetical protein
VLGREHDPAGLARGRVWVPGGQTMGWEPPLS